MPTVSFKFLMWALWSKPRSLSYAILSLLTEPSLHPYLKNIFESNEEVGYTTELDKSQSYHGNKERWRKGINYLRVMDSRKLFIDLLTYHDSSQVCCVCRKAKHTENGPKVHQKPSSPAFWWFDGCCSAKQEGVADIQGWGEGEDFVSVPPFRSHTKGALPLIQSEKDGSDM